MLWKIFLSLALLPAIAAATCMIGVYRLSPFIEFSTYTSPEMPGAPEANVVQAATGRQMRLVSMTLVYGAAAIILALLAAVAWAWA